MVVSDNFPHEIYIISCVGKTGYVPRNEVPYKGISMLGYFIIAIPEGSIIDKYDRHIIYIAVNVLCSSK